MEDFPGVVPDQMGAPEVAAFLSSLATDRHVSTSTQNQALSALVFLYRHVLGQALGTLPEVPRAKRPARLPVVLNRPEVAAVIGALSGVSRIVGLLLYGAGLRLGECLELRVKDLDFDLGQITIRRGKGQKDRVTMLQAIVYAPARAGADLLESRSFARGTGLSRRSGTAQLLRAVLSGRVNPCGLQRS